MKPDHILAHRRILIVEDEFMLADHLQDLLEGAGAIVLGPVPDVASALTLIASEKPDGAILDINLDGSLSYPVADVLIHQGIPFLFTSGYELDAIPAQYQHVSLCQKPLDPAGVIHALGRLARD